MKIRIELIVGDGTIYHGEALLTKAGKAKTNAGESKVPQAKLRCPDAVRKIWQQEMFKQPLSFSGIKSALSRDGYHFPDNTLMMALTNSGFLTRRGSKGSYQWTQRHPFDG